MFIWTYNERDSLTTMNTIPARQVVIPLNSINKWSNNYLNEIRMIKVDNYCFILVFENEFIWIYYTVEITHPPSFSWFDWVMPNGGRDR